MWRALHGKIIFFNGQAKIVCITKIYEKKNSTKNDHTSCDTARLILIHRKFKRIIFIFTLILINPIKLRS